jgi:hypothetical protein
VLLLHKLFDVRLQWPYRLRSVVCDVMHSGRKLQIYRIRVIIEAWNNNHEDGATYSEMQVHSYCVKQHYILGQRNL